MAGYYFRFPWWKSLTKGGVLPGYYWGTISGVAGLLFVAFQVGATRNERGTIGVLSGYYFRLPKQNPSQRRCTIGVLPGYYVRLSEVRSASKKVGVFERRGIDH